MGSTFSSLNAGLTGLYAAQRLIEVSGQNIINQNTPGYTRQRVEQKALGIGSEPSIFSGSVPQGGGVEITGERRLGDFFLDSKLRMETGRAASTKEITSGWKNVEAAMDELGRKSLSNALRSFYKSWGDVNNSSDNLGARATAIGNARALVDQIKTGYTHINDLWKNGRAELDALVSDLNTTMDSVMALNERIRKGTAMGANVNHLIDERDKLALHIADLTGATVRKGTSERRNPVTGDKEYYDDGSIEIMLAGNSMVGKNYVNHFKVEGSRDMPGIDAAPREVYQEAEKALKEKGYNLEDKIKFHGHEIQKYQAKVGVFKHGDKDAKGAAIPPDKIGKKYVAFYEKTDLNNENPPKHTGVLVDKIVQETVRDFSDRNFISDEGPVRLTWDVGGHDVAIEEGRIGGLMQNLKPAEVPGISGTIGRGGCWAETGKLYNDAATNIANEVNLIHANNMRDKDGNPIELGAGVKPNDSRSLLTKETTFKVIFPEPEEIPDAAHPGTMKPNPNFHSFTSTLTQKEGESDEAFQKRVDAQKAKLDGTKLFEDAGFGTKVKPPVTKEVSGTVEIKLPQGFDKADLKIRLERNKGETDDQFKTRVQEKVDELLKGNPAAVPPVAGKLEGTGFKAEPEYRWDSLATYADIKLVPDNAAGKDTIKLTFKAKEGEDNTAFEARVKKTTDNLKAVLVEAGVKDKAGAFSGIAKDPVYQKETTLELVKADGTAIKAEDIEKALKLERNVEDPPNSGNKKYKSDAEYDIAVQERIRELETLNPGCAVTYDSVKADGGDFFKFAAADNKLPPSLRLGVAIDDPMKIAAGVYNNGVYDGSVALRIGNQQDAATSSLNEWSKSVVDVGVHASGARDSYNLAEQTRRIADQQQKSQASVDMNEEVMNLIRGQHAYAGAARITSTVNSMLETLINLGR